MDPHYRIIVACYSNCVSFTCGFHFNIHGPVGGFIIIVPRTGLSAVTITIGSVTGITECKLRCSFNRNAVTVIKAIPISIAGTVVIAYQAADNCRLFAEPIVV